MTQLSQALTDLLTAAANAPGGTILASDEATTLIKSLIKRGMLISVPQSDGPSQLLITEAGRAAIAQKRPEVVDEGVEQTEAPAETPPPVADQEPTPPPGKIATLIAMLQQPAGTTIADMVAATGWQAHSVRGALSGAIKKQRGLAVTSEKTHDGRIYRIAA